MKWFPIRLCISRSGWWSFLPGAKILCRPSNGQMFGPSILPALSLRKRLKCLPKSCNRRARGHDEAPGAPHGGAGGAAGQATSGGLAGPGRPHPWTRPTSLTLRGTCWSAPRGRTTGTPGRRWMLRQRMRGLRSVSFQLPCEEDVLQSAFEDKPLCVPRQLAKLLQLSVEEVCADFDAMLRPRPEAPRHLRRGGARVLRVAQRPDARAELAGQPGGQPRSGAEGALNRVLLGL